MPGPTAARTRSTTRSSNPQLSIGISLYSLPNTVIPIFFTAKRSPMRGMTPMQGPLGDGVADLDADTPFGDAGCLTAGLAAAAVGAATRRPCAKCPRLNARQKAAKRRIKD